MIQNFVLSKLLIEENDGIPDVTNMSWQLSLSITGTETWCRMFGTPPPDNISIDQFLIIMMKAMMTLTWAVEHTPY